MKPNFRAFYKTSRLRQLAALAAGFGLSCFFLASCSRSGNPVKVSDSDAQVNVAAARVIPQTLSKKLVLAAEFRPFQQVDLHAKVAGYVQAIYVDVGDHVKKGQLLAVLEIPELRDEIAQAAADVRDAREEIAKHQSDLAAAQADHETNHLEYTRLAQAGAARPNLIAQQDIDDARGKDQASQARVAAARASLSAALEQFQSALANEKKLQTLYSYRYITAPFTGVITRRYADLGTMIQAGTASQTQASPVVRLSQNGLLRLVIPVPEPDVPYIHLGTRVAVRVPALNRVFQGKVSRFADKLNLSTRTMHTEADVPNPHLTYVPGMYAEVSVLVSERKKALSLPIQAVKHEQGRTVVYLVDDQQRVEKRRIKTGIETADRAEVLSGLKENDEVIVGNAGQLVNGQKVHPVLSAGNS